MTDKGIRPWERPRYTNAHFSEEEQKCWELRLRGLSIRRIAAELDMPKSTVDLRLRAVFDQFHEDSAAMRDQWIAMELERLDAAQVAVIAVLESNHLVVSDGRVVRMDGLPILDSGPVLAAVDRLVRISESRRRLLGLDAPSKHQVTHTDADLDAAVRELAEQLQQRAAGRPVPQE